MSMMIKVGTLQEQEKPTIGYSTVMVSRCWVVSTILVLVQLLEDTLMIYLNTILSESGVDTISLTHGRPNKMKDSSFMLTMSLYLLELLTMLETKP